MVLVRFSIGPFRLPSGLEVRRKVGRPQAELWPKRGTCPAAVLFVNSTISAKHVLSLILLQTVKVGDCEQSKVCFMVDCYNYSPVYYSSRERATLPKETSYYNSFRYLSPILWSKLTKKEGLARNFKPFQTHARRLDLENILDGCTGG